MDPNLTTHRRPLLRHLLVACASVSLLAPAPVPRQSPDLAFQMPSGEMRLLSSFRGKVVLIEFLLTDCPRCARLASTIGKLDGELGPRGFQPLGMAFDTRISGPAVTSFVQLFKVTYPVGYTSSDKVDGYLGRAPAEHLRVPQLVVIDRAGVIRAQSSGRGDPNLESEAYLRNLIKRLL